MAGKTIDFDENTEVGGFNPERHVEKKKDPVGPAPTDDPKHAAAADLEKRLKHAAQKNRG